MENYLHQRLEIKLSINEKSGEPFIKVRKRISQQIDQQMLNLFIREAVDRGLQIEFNSGYASSEGGGWDDYIISLKPKQINNI